jgi:hypothetical protein
LSGRDGQNWLSITCNGGILLLASLQFRAVLLGRSISLREDTCKEKKAHIHCLTLVRKRRSINYFVPFTALKVPVKRKFLCEAVAVSWQDFRTKSDLYSLKHSLSKYGQ